jgi:hypothetical protein
MVDMNLFMFFGRIRVKKLLAFLFIVTMSVLLIGCNNQTTSITTSNLTTETTSNGSTETTTIVPPKEVFSIEDFYNQIVLYEQRFIDLIGENPTESIAERKSIFRPMTNGSVSQPTQTITREEILAVYHNASFNFVNDAYKESLSTTALFVSAVKELIEEQEGIALFEPFHPQGDPTQTYSFILSQEGYLLIHAWIDTVHLYLKLGLTENLLEYTELIYSYSGESLNPKDRLEQEFNFFRFVENKEAIAINRGSTVSSLNYISIENDEQFTISVATADFDGTPYEHYTYTLNFYNRILNTQSYLEIYNDEIISETYDIFDEHGDVLRLIDSEEIVQLTVNFVTATGWDYVIASDYSNPEIDAITGIYLNDGTKIYDNYFQCTYTPTYGHLGISFQLESKEDLTNDVLRLNQFGLNLDHPRATVEFLNEIVIEDFSEIKALFQIDGLDIFARDLEAELYHFIDADIRSDLEGTNIEPIITTGDIASFQEAVDQFNANLGDTPNYNSESTILIHLYDANDSLLSTSTSNNYASFDLNQMFYKFSSYASSFNSSDRFSYYIDGTKGNLVEYEIKNSYARYNIVSDVATQEKFLELYNALFDNFDLTDVKSITKMNNTTFEFLVTSRFLGSNGVDLVTLLEQSGIAGLANQDIAITYAFSEDYSSYEITYTIQGLSYGDYRVEIDSISTIIIEPITVLSPLDSNDIAFYLPKTVENILFVTTVSNSKWYGLETGKNYLKLYLEPGHYSLDIYGFYNHPNVVIMDYQWNVLEYEGRFEATYEGTYYALITSAFRQSAMIGVRVNEIPIFNHYELDSQDGVFEATVQFHGISGNTITIPASNQDRIIIVRPYFISPAGPDEDIHIHLTLDEINYERVIFLMPNQVIETGYLYLPKDQDITLDLNGYFIGTFGFSYEYLIIPSGEFENVTTWHDLSTSPILWMTEESEVARLNFTVTESGFYQLSTLYVDFGYSYQDAKLYTSAGVLLANDWTNAIGLSAGDYYILFTPGYADKILVLVIPSITKQE